MEVDTPELCTDCTIRLLGHTLGVSTSRTDHNSHQGGGTYSEVVSPRLCERCCQQHLAYTLLASGSKRRGHKHSSRLKKRRRQGRSKGFKEMLRGFFKMT